MAQAADTQALVWLEALKQELYDIGKNLDYCVRTQSTGQLAQEEFDEFVAKINRFAKKIVASTEGKSSGG